MWSILSQARHVSLNIGQQIDANTDRLKLNPSRGVYKQVYELSTTESVKRKLEAKTRIVAR